MEGFISPISGEDGDALKEALSMAPNWVASGQITMLGGETSGKPNVVENSAYQKKLAQLKSGKLKSAASGRGRTCPARLA